MDILTPLIEKTLFETIDKVKTAIERLRAFEPDEGYYLAFSGGKDSCVIKALADMAGVKYDAHYNVSGIDPPELVRFIKEHHSDVTWDRFDIPFLLKLRHWGFPLPRKKWCCKIYKEAGGARRLVLTGVRWAESPKRRNRNMTESCYDVPGKRFLHVIIDWLYMDVWDFLKGNNIPYCHLYDEGWSRLGCIACPEKQPWMKKRDFAKWPIMEKVYRQAFRALYKRRVRQGKDSVDRWKDGDEMFDWWIDNPPKKSDEPGLWT